eukprot:RCo045359
MLQPEFLKGVFSLHLPPIPFLGRVPSVHIAQLAAGRPHHLFTVQSRHFLLFSNLWGCGNYITLVLSFEVVTDLALCRFANRTLHTQMKCFISSLCTSGHLRVVSVACVATDCEATVVTQFPQWALVPGLVFVVHNVLVGAPFCSTFGALFLALL